MLDFDDPRWLELKSHFGTPSDVTRLISNWRAAIGTPEENDCYVHLYEHYLHQQTILSCTYAVVPHLVSELHRMEPLQRLKYLVDVADAELHRLPAAEAAALVESVRTSADIPESLRDHFVRTTRDRHPELPADLAPDYLGALDDARILAIALLPEPLSPRNFCLLLGVLTALFAKQEDALARALTYPEGLSLASACEGRASISTLLSDYQPPDD